MNKPKLFRITTVPESLKTLLKGQLSFMSNHGFTVKGITSEGEGIAEIRSQENVDVFCVEMTRKITPLKDLKALFQLVKVFKKEKPDIVHTHTPKAGLLGMIAAKIAGVPHRLHTIAGLPLTVATGVKRKILNQTEKTTYACATKVYPNSYGLQKIVLQHNFTSPDKLKVIGNGSTNGIDTSEFNPKAVTDQTKQNLRKELEIGEEDFMFLFVGRVVTDKGVNELVKAFQEIHKHHSKAHLVIVGSYENHLDPLEADTEKITQDHPNIHAVGYKTNVTDYFATADVLTFPSYREGFPNVVMQAAAMQLNAIVSDINGCNEIITNGENGWIIPVKNSEKLSERMQWCIEHKEASRQMGMKSRTLMKEKYERSFVQQEILKEYQKLLDPESSSG